MPRRIYVGLLDLGNRCKILKTILNKENLEALLYQYAQSRVSSKRVTLLRKQTRTDKLPYTFNYSLGLEFGFSFEQLAEATDGYSWSDLKNLCVSAVYGPIEEFLEQESKIEASDGVPPLRPLSLNDFIYSKSKVRPSVAPNSSNNPQPMRYPQRYREPELYKRLPNMDCIKPPKDEDILDIFHEQIEQDKLTFLREANFKTMHKVLKHHNLSCMNMEHPTFEDMMLKRKSIEVEKIVGWAVNHYLSSCPLPCVNEEKLHIPHDSMKHVISRFMEEKNYTSRPKKKLKSIQDHEKWLDSTVVRSDDIDVKFDDVGVLESVKKVLYKTVILPMRRPELFSHGNLKRPCKEVLLFGPPGTRKTIISKALATESGANFINIIVAAFTSMVGEIMGY